jgi:uncharacterized protein (DUF1330 family)
MLNLLRYRERAEYGPGPFPEAFDATPCSGREAYARYVNGTRLQIEKYGGRVVWRGAVAVSLIGPAGEEWDDFVLVEYPSREAFLKMLDDPEYRAGFSHRKAALQDSRLIAAGHSDSTPSKGRSR